MWKISLCVSNCLKCGLSVNRQGPRAWIYDLPSTVPEQGPGTGEVKVWPLAELLAEARGRLRTPLPKEAEA